MNKKTYKEAIECYGKEIVYEAIQFVELFDADGAYTNFQDSGMPFHAEVIELLYFN